MKVIIYSLFIEKLTLNLTNSCSQKKDVRLLGYPEYMIVKNSYY